VNHGFHNDTTPRYDEAAATWPGTGRSPSGASDAALGRRMGREELGAPTALQRGHPLPEFDGRARVVAGAVHQRHAEPIRLQLVAPRVGKDHAVLRTDPEGSRDLLGEGDVAEVEGRTRHLEAGLGSDRRRHPLLGVVGLMVADLVADHRRQPVGVAGEVDDALVHAHAAAWDHEGVGLLVGEDDDLPRRRVLAGRAQKLRREDLGLALHRRVARRRLLGSKALPCLLAEGLQFVLRDEGDRQVAVGAAGERPDNAEARSHAQQTPPRHAGAGTRRCGDPAVIGGEVSASHRASRSLASTATRTVWRSSALRQRLSPAIGAPTCEAHAIATGRPSLLHNLLRMFQGGAVAPADPSDRHRLAAAALLVTAGAMDDDFDAEERARVLELLESRFALDPADAAELLADGESMARESVDLYGFTSAIKAGFEPEERVDVLEMVWEVVYADGVLHDHEASLMRRLAGLLGVTDRESGDARVRVRERLGL
jgi:uncharacterized tellurite resistance protein B-like protein